LYVVAASTDELAAIEPSTGRVHWQLARPGISFPRWGGSRTDTRIAYLTRNDLHVVAGDGTGDTQLSASARVAPVWQPATTEHVLAYVDARGRIRIGGRVASRAFAGARALAWSQDGRTLALATRDGVVELTVATGRTHTIRVPGVRALAFAPDGRLALLRGNGVLLLDGDRVRTLFVAPSRLDGLAWSPDGRWLLSSLPQADQWVFVQTRGARRVLAVSHIRRQFGGEPSLDGWAPAA